MIIVGLPDAAVQESRERVQMAIKNAGLISPPQTDHSLPGSFLSVQRGACIRSAHRGVLTLDELPEFGQGDLEMMHLGR